MSALEEIRRLRLSAQQLVPQERAPHTVAGALLGMQAQDLFSAKWSVGLRTGQTEAEVDAAFERGELVRSWPLRGTLHIHAAEDLPWLSRLLGPRVIETTARRRAQLGLDARTLEQAAEVARAALEIGPRTRQEMLDAWMAAKIEVSGQRGYHLLFHLGVQGLICLGPLRAGEPCFVLVERWIRHPRVLDADQALGELARRYFESHGPAPTAELATWAKLKADDARRALARARPHLQARIFDGVEFLLGASVAQAPPGAWLLPGFDEYVLGYRDRSAFLDAQWAERIVPGGNGVFQPTLVIDGRIVGTWRRKAKPRALALTLMPFERLPRAHRAALETVAQTVGRFSNQPVELDWG